MRPIESKSVLIRCTFLVLFLCFASLSLPKGWRALRGAALHNLALYPKTEGNSCQLEPSVFEVLDQPFISWSRGSQSEVFLSQDGKWVLKIPRNKKHRSYLFGQFWKKKKNRGECLKSYLDAAEKLADETAVLFVSRGEKLTFPKHFALLDRLKRPLATHFESYPFALQGKKPLLAKRLLKAIDSQEAKVILSSLLTLIEREKEKGWVCRDYAFMLNLGYENGSAYRIDIGDYVPILENFSLKRVVKPIDRFLQEHASKELQSWWHQEVQSRQ